MWKENAANPHLEFQILRKVSGILENLESEKSTGKEFSKISSSLSNNKEKEREENKTSLF